MARKKHEAHENHERWLVSYADFITLLFAFFVVMFATSQTDKGKAQQVSDSVKKALDHLRADAVVTRDPNVAALADKIILPGVGHFSATAILEQDGLRDAILRRIEKGVPFLGVCVGMQWMFESSAEAPGMPGLGLFSGACGRFPDSVKSPHVGWNSLVCREGSRLLRGKIGDCHDCWPVQPSYSGSYKPQGERGQRRQISDPSYLRAALEPLSASIAIQLLHPQR